MPLFPGIHGVYRSFSCRKFRTNRQHLKQGRALYDSAADLDMPAQRRRIGSMFQDHPRPGGCGRVRRCPRALRERPCPGRASELPVFPDFSAREKPRKLVNASIYWNLRIFLFDGICLIIQKNQRMGERARVPKFTDGKKLFRR